eukprot:XP_001709572.1 Hypothetical protein GL50803_2802 [Giardia lamblia ATCC 50803]
MHGTQHRIRLFFRGLLAEKVAGNRIHGYTPIMLAGQRNGPNLRHLTGSNLLVSQDNVSIPSNDVMGYVVE